MADGDISPHRGDRQPSMRHDRAVEWLRDTARDVVEQRSPAEALREPLDELRRAERARKRSESALRNL